MASRWMGEAEGVDGRAAGITKIITAESSDSKKMVLRTIPSELWLVGMVNVDVNYMSSYLGCDTIRFLLGCCCLLFCDVWCAVIKPKFSVFTVDCAFTLCKYLDHIGTWNDDELSIICWSFTQFGCFCQFCKICCYVVMTLFLSTFLPTFLSNNYQQKKHSQIKMRWTNKDIPMVQLSCVLCVFSLPFLSELGFELVRIDL